MILVSTSQKGNGILNYITKSLWSYSPNIKSDYEVDGDISILFLSLRFHLCKPDYIYKKIKIKYNLKILLLLVDIPNYELLITELFEFCDFYDTTIILSYSNEEAARYIQSFDLNKKRTENIIQKKEGDHKMRFLCGIPKITKEDAVNLEMKYKNIKNIINSSGEELKGINNMGDKKIKSMKEYWEMSFK
ncbi:Ercc1 DNA repair protein [Spraguea lophii 42_110]|uniref:Ercc1 DNA repair protein n=1 Tax=Spraguea lophii (strain 42_110) TaxID=1358809 RepID=S7XK76_SPRLO|nr:Ercc1 DNA repair protein [Spraguea lophii 42_110]